MVFKMPLKREPRLLQPDTPGLPEDFAVFEGDDPYDICNEVRFAFMSDPRLTLVVWSGAPAFLSDPEDTERDMALRAAVQKLSDGVGIASQQIKTKLEMESAFDWNFSEHDRFELSIKSHFADIADFTQSDIAALGDWQKSTHALAEAIQDELTASKITLATRFKSAAHDVDGMHIDNGLRSNSMRVLRTVAGNTTNFYSDSDVDYISRYRGAASVHLKDAAQPWAVAPWDVAFVSQNVAHEAGRGQRTDRRTIEVYDVKSTEEFIASAQRPFFRKLFRRPTFADF